MEDEVVMYCELKWRFSDDLPEKVKEYCKKEFLRLIADSLTRVMI